jgi:2-keto-4-pentenoate hydratase/2-oxohepta-3-ene-1,7-dioic acid hydratase in catechol pathway
MRLYRYKNSGSPALGVQVGDYIFNCVKLFEEAGEKVPEVVERADMRAICAAPEPVIVFLEQFLEQVKSVRQPDRKLAVPVSEAQLLAPLPDPTKIVCIGLNYLDHCEEQNKPKPERPMLFAKFANTIAGPTDDVEIPDNTDELDFEGELAVIIGRPARRVTAARAMDHVFGYMALLDVSARDLQRTDGQWVRAKSQDGFAPCGPCIVTADEVGDPHRLTIRTKVNGALMQDSTTGNMIFRIDELIAFVSQSLTLQPGDIISTGTPAGVGVHRNPQVLLKNGDLVEVSVGKIGTLTNRFIGR